LTHPLIKTIALTLSILAATTAASAADINVLTAGAYKAALLAQLPEFERLSGHKVSVQNDTAGALARRIRSGEVFDLVILTAAAVDDLVRSGELAAGTAAPLAKVGIGVAVKQGAPLPDLSSTAAFRQALLNARAVAFIDPKAGGTSGIYLVQLFEKMGIGAQIAAKSVLVPGGYSAERLVSGEADIAVQQMSELVSVAGAQVVGQLPAEVQVYTTYSGAISGKSAERAAAMQLLSALQQPAARAALDVRGLIAP
jgi:molybdate transport system substrate-binding protein